MPRSSPPPEDRTQFQDSPIAWFGELLIALERGNYPRATEAQSHLARLGWKVTRSKARRTEGGD